MMVHFIFLPMNFDIYVLILFSLIRLHIIALELYLSFGRFSPGAICALTLLIVIYECRPVQKVCIIVRDEQKWYCRHSLHVNNKDKILSGNYMN